MPADHGRTRHRANFGGAQQGHRQLGLWQGTWQRWDPPRPNQAPQDHLTAFSACSALSIRSCPRRHEGHQDHHFVQEQGREEQLQLSIFGKVFAEVILIQLQKLAERVYPESQCGFRAGRSTTDMVFSFCQLQEKCREQQMPLYITFSDLTKAFDLVSRDGLFQIIPRTFSMERVGIWKENQRPPTAALQGCLQERHNSTQHQHQALGGPCSRLHEVEKHSEPTPQVRGREAGECRSRKKDLHKGAQQLQQTRDHTQM